MWTELTGTATGNSAILSYNLYWDNGTGNSNIELVDSLQTNFTVTGLTGGVNYKFKVRARNIYGYSDFSDEYFVWSTDVPGKPQIPTVLLSSTNVVITWVSPFPHFAIIDSYEILFKKVDNSFIALQECDGS
jgi:hypothetical protein